jgi:hypothetical protein
MSTFMAYMLRQEERKRAYAEYNAASLGLELARIKERLAQIESQHEPLGALNSGAVDYDSARKKQLAVAFYVVVGRMPSEGGGT